MDTNRLNGTATAEPPEEPRVATTVNINQRFKIPGDVIAKTCQELPDDQRHAVQWAAGFCRERNLTVDEFGQMLTQPGADQKPYSGDSVYQALTGRRNDGSLERFAKAVHTLRKRLEETSSRESVRFIETGLSRQIFSACRAAFLKKRIVMIFGETQIGKSRNINEYARRYNHGETKVFMMPTRPTLTSLMHEFAIRLGISTQNRTEDLKRRIFECFDERTLPIIDECERCVDGRNAGLDCLDFLRELFERRKCGMVLIGANDFRNALRTNYTLKKLWLRGYRPLQLPARPNVKDLAEFARAFGLSPAEDKKVQVDTTVIDADGEEREERIVNSPLQLQSTVIKDDGLGRWLMILEDAADSAKEKGSRMSWGRVIVAHHLIKSVETVH
jgi:DNA transposition AAA+ family ATPase